MSNVAGIPHGVQLVPPEFADLAELLGDDDPFAVLNDEGYTPPDWPDPPARAPEPSLPLPEWFESQASYYRSLGTDLGDYCAGLWDDQAALARRRRVLTVADMALAAEAQIEFAEAVAYDRGYDRGLAVGMGGDVNHPLW